MAAKGPQIEDGYTRIANELLEALCRLKCSNAEIRLAMAIIRLTYGIYGRKSARIETKELTMLTGLPGWHIGKARGKLVKRNIISVSLGANQHIKTYRFNKYYTKWLDLAQGPSHTPGANSVGPGGRGVGPGGKPTLYKENKKKTKRKNGGSDNPPADPPPDNPKNLPPPNIYKNVIEFLNAMTGSKFSHTAKETRAHIRARWRDGFTEQDMKDVITVKSDQWLGDPKATAWLRPTTLFRPSKFEGYLQEAHKSKTLQKSEKKTVKERKFKLAAGIYREEGPEKCLAYLTNNRVDPEEWKLWIRKAENKDLIT